MDYKLMESYLDNIAEKVVDEDKVVTYKSLSRSLGIHVNTAKQLLYTYLTNEKSRNSFPISATYLVAGKVVDGSFNVVIVNEADLKNAYSNFVEVTSEHVYSIQKGKNLKELKVLCAVDKESSNSDCPNLVIKCSKGVVKQRGEVKRNSEIYKENNKKIVKAALAPKEEDTTAQKQPLVSENIKEPESGETTSKCPKKPSPKGNSEKAAKKPVGNIANLFAKAAQKRTSKTEKADDGTSKEGGEVEVVNVKQDKLKAERENVGKRTETKESLKKKIGSKRKRIQMLSDSDESDNDEEEIVDSDEDEAPPVNFNTEKEDVKDTTPRNKRKKRKVIDKTVMNEDGYLETRKEVVFETDSESEAEEVAPAATEQKKVKMDDKGKRAQGTAKKQSSLLTFFKKS